MSLFVIARRNDEAICFMPSTNLHIQLNDIGKKFGKEWIFKNIHLSIDSGDKLVILGGNGSGKSTLLQIISGYVLPNAGDLNYNLDGKSIDKEEYQKYLSLASPYLDLIEDYTLEEIINHCAIYKPFLKNLDTAKIIELSGLSATKNKFIKNYSSGMRQRVRLTLAILADCELLLLDEPVSNLDKNAIDWFKGLVKDYASHKTIIVCSNSIKEEFEFCTKELNVADYKKN